MIRRAVLAAVLGALAVPAEQVARASAPRVDVDDLPPLPTEDAPSSAATVLAAAVADEEVVAGAAKREQSLGNVASAVTVVTGDRIRRFGYRTVGEAVAAVAGLYLVDNRLSYSVGIRGLQIPGDFNGRLLVLVDGATANEAWGAFAGVGYEALVALDDVERIEVIRGPVSSLYGTSAFFGIINIVTRAAAETPRAWARTAINSVHGSISSAGFAAGATRRQLRGSLQVVDRFGDTTRLDALPGARLSGDGSTAIGGSLVAAYDGSFAQVRAYRYARASPFAPYDVDPARTPYLQHDTQLLVEGGHTRALSERVTVTGRLYGNFYKFDDRAVPRASPPLDTTGTAQAYGGELRGRYEVVAPNRLGVTAGVEASHDRTRSTAHTEDGDPRNAVDVPLIYDVQGAYAELDAQPTRWLGWTAGLRYDRRAVSRYGGERSAGEIPDANRLSPRAALFLAEPERYGLKLLYAQGFRYPSAFEGYFYDNFDFAANPKIGAEQIRSYELALWARPMAGLSLRLSGFQWVADHIIEQRAADSDPGKLQFHNAELYVSRGVEAEASYRDGRGWYAFGGAALARVGAGPRASEVAYGRVANAPAITASGGISTPRLFGRLHVSSELVVIGERATRGAEISPAWVGWNAALYLPDVAGFDITAGVRNLLGIRELVPAPGDYDRTLDAEGRPAAIPVLRVPGEGRELFVKVGYAY